MKVHGADYSVQRGGVSCLGGLVWDLQRVPAFFSWHTGTHLSLIPSTDVRECCKRHRIYLARNIFAINNS